MTRSRIAIGATLLTAAAALSTQACAAPDQKRVAADACKGQGCRHTNRVEGDCGISVEPEWLFVSGKNVQLVFDILPAGFYFRPFEGIRFKDEYNPEWRSELFEERKGEGGEGYFADVRPANPSRQSVWRDLNTRPGAFRYAVTVVNARTQQECAADPGVVNDSPVGEL
jgi:hypothetical protein